MKVTLESKNLITTPFGPVRRWEGHTDTGVPVHIFSIAIGVPDPDSHDMSEFDDMTHVADVEVLPARPMQTDN